MRKTRFVIDTNEDIYEGYTDGTLWNGWECPWFTKEVADKMVRDFIRDGGEAKYDPKTDSYTFLGENWGSKDVFDGDDVETEDGIQHLYPIGAWCWIWDEVEKEEEKVKTWAEELFENHGKARGLAIMILDMFEDMLDEKGIMIPDDDRTGAEGEACLYGCTYGDLEDEIAYLLDKYV